MTSSKQAKTERAIVANGKRSLLDGYRRGAILATLGLLTSFSIVGTAASIAAVELTNGGAATRRVLFALGAIELLGFAVIGVLAVSAIEDRIAGTFGSLIAGARKFAAGDLNHRIDPGRHQEIEELSGAFNQMAGSLRMTVDGLKQSDERLRAILESAAEGIVLLDPKDGRIVESNRRFAMIAGRDPVSIAGIPIGLLTKGFGAEELEGMARRLENGERIDAIRGAFGRPDGSELPVETTASLATAGGRALLLLMVRDVSERDALEQEIRSNNEKLRHLFGVATRLRHTRDLAEQAQIIVDGLHGAGWGRAVLYLYRDGWALEQVAYAGFTEDERSILEANALSPERRRGLFEEVLPRYRIGNCFFVPGDAPRALEILPTILPSAIPASESLGWHPDDSLLIPLEGRDGGILASISVDDPVDRKRPTQDSLHVLELFAAAAGATIEEDRLHHQLVRSERLKALGEMAGGVAHDFNNILGAILGRAQLLLTRAEGLEMRRSLAVIEKAARDGAETVKRIQEFTRVRQDHAFTMTDVSDLIRDTLEITRSRWRDEAEASGIRYEVHVDTPPELFVLGNASELREVFTNLLLNALDAMPEGGRLDLEGSRENGEVRVIIRDSGHGMSEAVRGRVFDPFFTTKGVRGTGLGLSVSYGIARRHGGDIQVASLPGAGTTFTVIFPVGAEGFIAEPTGPFVQSERGRILAVDDEDNVRFVLEEILSMHGHTVVAASNGELGLEAFDKQGPFDVIITDLGMPGISGWEFSRRVRERDPQARIILSTGWGGTLVPEDLDGTGVSRVLSKPFEMTDLLAAIGEELREHRAAPIR